MTEAQRDKEQLRLRVLAEYGILDTRPEEAFDDLVQLAAHISNMPMAALSFLDADRQWFKARVGMSMTETGRDIAFCNRTIESGQPYQVEDAASEPELANNPLVTEAPYIRAYAGVPLNTREGFCIGSLAVMDHQPRQLLASQIQSLESLAQLAMHLLDQRRLTSQIEDSLISENQRRLSEQRFGRLLDNIPDVVVLYGPDLRIRYVNPATRALTGLDPESLIGKRDEDLFPAETHLQVIQLLERCRQNLATCGAELDLRLPAHSDPLRLRITCVPLLDVDGQLSEIIGITQDLTRQLQTDRALIESRQLADSAERIARLGGWRVDLATETVYWSERVAEIRGLPSNYRPSVDEAIGYYVPEHQGQIRNAFDCCATQGAAFDLELQILNADGRRVWVRTTGEAVRDPHGQIVGIQGALQDISERRLAEQRLHEQAERTRAILETASDAVITISESAVIESVNPAVHALFGYRPDELIGSKIDLLMPEEYRLHHDHYVSRYLDTGQARLIGESRQLTGLRKNGEQFPIELSVGEVQLSDRRIFTGFIRDISRQEASRQALLASEERFRNVARVTSDVIWDLDCISNRLWWSDGLQSSFGYGRQELAETLEWWRQRVHPDDCDRVDQSLVAAIHGDAEEWKAEYRFRCSDGSYADVADNSVIIRDEQGRATRIVGGMRDLTQELAMERQLAQAQRLDSIGQLTGGIAHDFNNLLTVILGNAELLSELLEQQDDRYSMASLIQTAAQRGADLTSRLLTFARRQALEPQPTNVAELIEGMRPLLRRSIPANIELQIEHEPDLWLAEVDPVQLESSLLNLAINSRDAMPNGGQLQIRASNIELDEEALTLAAGTAAGPFVRIEVSDNGSGIAEKHLGAVFEPFFTTKPKEKGTGLGLAMVYGFIKQSMGHIELESEQGDGTRIRLYLPKAINKASRPAANSGLASASSGQSRRVLIVEDDEMVMALAARLFRASGFEVETAANGDQALAVLEADPAFDLLFSDVIMPGGLKGPALARRALDLIPGLKVLLTSGYTDDAYDHDNDFHLLDKPYRRNDLLRKLQEVLGER